MSPRSRLPHVVPLVALGIVALLAACGSAGETAADATAPPTAAATASRAEPTAVQQVEPTPDTSERRTPQPSEAPPRTPGDEPSRIEFESDGFVAADPLGELRYASIRDVDFRNGFTYLTGFDETFTATVAEGQFETGEPRGEDYFLFGVNGVDFGDLDGDGSDDAIIATTWNGGGTGYFDSVLAFRLRDGRLESAGRVPFGDRADGGIHSVEIEDQAVLVRSFGTNQGACCPNRIIENRLVLGERFLTVGERGDARTWLSTQTSDEEIVFVPGTSAAVLEVWGDVAQETFRFEGGAGQRVHVRLLDGPTPAALSLDSEATGSIEFAVAEDVELPVGGLYELDIVFDDQQGASTLLELSIDAADPHLSWTPQVAQTVVTDDPFVFTSLLWPRFEAPAAGTADANVALAEFVAGLDDYWIEDVTEYSEPQGESSYEVRYDVTPVAYDLVSVRFDFFDYVCCRPYPGYGPHAAVVDLAAGRLLELDEILDLDRRQEIIEIWAAELLVQSEIDAAVLELTGEAPDFDSVGLVPGGVEFGTERGALGGGTPGTLTVVSFDRLGDLVRPELVGRISGD